MKIHQNVLVAVALLATTGAASAGPTAAELERGRYVTQTSGCNDCHTPGYPESGGTLPAAEWLTGSDVGFQGPWGTSYPSNLRLTVQELTEEQWLALARSPRLPPMPWFSLRDMSDADLIAMYHFIRSLGPKGERAPAPAAPGVRVETAFFDFVPKVAAEADADTRTAAR